MRRVRICIAHFFTYPQAQVRHLLSLLIVVLLASHLLCMNVCSAGPLLCIWLNRKHATAESKQIGKALAWDGYWLLFVGVLFGLGLGTVCWASGDARLVETLPLLHSKVLWGIAEIGCSLVWAWCYWAWLQWRPPQRAIARFLHASLAVLSATNLLYHFPPLMTVMSQAASGEMVVSVPVDSSAYRALIFTPNVMAHSLHIWLASFAVSGVFLFWLARKLADPRGTCVFGARVALVATLAQLGSGSWLLVVTPPQKQSLLLGEDWVATGLLVASVLAAFKLLEKLAALAFGEPEPYLPRRCAWLMVLTVAMMAGALRQIHS